MWMYEDYNTHPWTASSIADLIEENREKLSAYIDYNVLQEEDWVDPTKRLGFALMIAETAHHFSSSGVEKFARYCRSVDDQVSLNKIKGVLLELERDVEDLRTGDNNL